VVLAPFPSRCQPASNPTPSVWLTMAITFAPSASGFCSCPRTLEYIGLQLSTSAPAPCTASARILPVQPPGVKLDLDLIVHDSHKSVVWIIDAKNAEPKGGQLRKMLDQIPLLEKAPQISGGRPVMGVIVHRKHQLSTPISPTEQHNVLRCTPHGLHQLLQARALPGTGREPGTQPKAA